MNDDVPTLEVGFAIDSTSSFDNLMRLDGLVDRATANALEEFAKVERASKGLLDLSGATARITSFGNAATKEAQATARDISRVEKAGEALSRQLERQAASFGKNREEMRAMKVEAAALAAEEQGLAELAMRLRSQETDLYAQEYAAMQKARHEVEALAEDKALAAQRAVEAAEIEAQAMREAAYAHQMFEARVRAGAQALRELEAAEKIAGREAAAAQMRAEADAARALAQEHDRLAATVRASHAAQMADADGAERIRMSTDPLYAATKRLNDEIAESTRLYYAGATARTEYERQQAVLTGRLREATQVHESNQKIISRGSGTLTQLSFQLNDVATMAASGAPAFQIFATQAGQIFQVAQMAEGGVKGFAAQLGGLALAYWPVIAIAGTAAAAVGLITAEINKNSAVTVTWKDTLLGAWDAAKEFLDEQLTKAFAYFGVTTADVWKDVVEITKWAVNWMIGIASLPVRNLVAAFQTLPAAIGDAFYSGVNVAIRAINWLVEKGVGAINAFTQTVNAVLPEAFQIPTISAPKIKEIENSYAGAGRAAGKALLGSITDTFSRDFIGDAASAIAPYAVARAKARAEKAGAEVGKAMGARVKGALSAEVDGMSAILEQAYINVQRLAADIAKRQQDWGKGEPTWGQQDVAAREAADRLRQAEIDNARAALQAYMDDLDRVSDRVDDVASNMRRAFGSVGGAIGDLITVLDEYGKRQSAIDKERDLGGLTEKRTAELRKAEASNQLSGMIALTGAAKGLFNEHSKGYKAMAAAEKALTIIQLARTAVDVAGGAARMFAQLGPFAFPAVTAMLGVMAGLGFFGGGSSSNSLPKSNTGTGTVLGDGDAKSESIKRSIDALKDVDTLTMNTSRDMLASLRSIDANIGGLSTLLVRTGNIDASGGVETGFKTDTTGNVLSRILDPFRIVSKVPVIGDVVGAINGVIKGLFGTSTKVVGSGLFGGAQSLDAILSGGFDASYYSDVQKKKKLFGLTTSTKYSTSYTGADSEIEDQFTLLLRQFYTAIGQTAGPLGASLTDIEARLRGFTVDIGKIDLQGLTGAEIEEKLQAVFGAAADDMAQAAMPGLERFQQVGEGYFETLVRVASTVEVVTSTFALLGRQTSAMGIDVNMAIAGLFDSVSDFTNASQAYFEAYYSQAEQTAARATQLGAAFASIGVTMPDTLAGFRALVEAQNLTTEAGRATYATLLQMAPAFADLQAAMSGAKSAADILSERQGLERKLLEQQGDTAAIRALDLAKLDASNRALQEQIYAMQDAQEAAKAADELRKAWTSVGDSIMDEVKRIRGLSGTAGDGSFASLMGQFNMATAGARAGDQDLAKNLPGISQALLSAAALNATSRQELERVKAQTAASLEATYNIIGALSGTGAASTAATLSAAANATQATTPEAANDDMAAEIKALRAEMAQMRADNNAGHAATAGNTAAVKRHLDNVTNASGGEAISVAGVAA